MEKCERLAQTIMDKFESGIELDADTLAHIDSTLSYPTADDLLDTLQDRDNDNRDSLLELVFFPAEEIQIELEPLLQSAQYDAEDAADLVRLLVAKHIVATIRFSDQRPDIRLAVPEEALDSFVSRLRIDVKLPQEVIACIERHIPEADRGALKVRLRNHRQSLTQTQSRFVGELLMALADDDDLLGCVDFVLAFFGDVGDTGAWYDALVDRKRALAQDLKKSERYMALLNSDNFETLVMRGVRIPLIDLKSIQHQIALIDKICIKVYGKTDWNLWSAHAAAPIDCRTEDDLKMVVRRFLD